MRLPNTIVSSSSHSSAHARLPSNSSKIFERMTSRTFVLESSPAPVNAFGFSVEHSEPAFQLELSPDLFENSSFLDLLDFTSVADNDNFTKSPAERVSSNRALKPRKRERFDQAMNPTEHNSSEQALSSSKVSSSNVIAPPIDDAFLADFKEQLSTFEMCYPDPEQQQVLQKDHEDTLNQKEHEEVAIASPSSRPSLSNEVQSKVRKFAASEEMRLAESEAKKFAEAEAMKFSESEAMQPFSTKSASSIPSQGELSLRRIDTVSTSVPEGNLSEARLTFAGQSSPTPSISGQSWATSCFSPFIIPQDLECNFLNGNHPQRHPLPFIPPPANPLKTGWRILCLDAGGVRGLSMLYIIHELMLSIQTRLQLERAPLPYEIFEMICGVGTGGIIALLLGRLRLDIPFAISAYLEIVRKVFGQSKRVIAALTRTARFNASKLEEVVRQVVTQISGEPELPLADVASDSHCRTFLIALRPSENKGERSTFRKLRSYPYASMMPDTCSVALAARATSAAPLVLKSTALDDEHGRIHPVSSDSCINNLSLEALEEALALFPHRPIDCLVSLGVGKGIASASGPIARACAAMSQSCERTSRKVELKSHREGWAGSYFRLAVKGLKNEDGGEEWGNPESVKAATAAYLYTEEKAKFQKQVKKLSNSWKGAYDDEIFKSLMKVESKGVTTSHTPIFPPQERKLSTEMLRRSISVDQVQHQANFGEKIQSLRTHTVGQASAITARVRSKVSSIHSEARFSRYDSNISRGLFIQHNPSVASGSTFSNA